MFLYSDMSKKNWVPVLYTSNVIVCWKFYDYKCLYLEYNTHTNNEQ